MHAESLREALERATPQTPVVVFLPDGTEIRLGHADYFWMGRGGRTLVVNVPGDKDIWIDTALITRAEAVSLD